MTKRWIAFSLLAALVGVTTACAHPVALPTIEQSRHEFGVSPQNETLIKEVAQAKIVVDRLDLTNLPDELDEIRDSGSGEKISSIQETKQKLIEVFYTDPEQTEVKKATCLITFKSDWGKYKSAFKALQHSDRQELIPLWADEISLNNLEVKNGNITIDLHIPPTANLGSGGEQFAIDALKDTFFQFEEVKSLELLVDGKQEESLMGHVELEHPMTRNEDEDL